MQTQTDTVSLLAMAGPGRGRCGGAEIQRQVGAGKKLPVGVDTRQRGPHNTD